MRGIIAGSALFGALFLVEALGGREGAAFITGTHVSPGLMVLGATAMALRLVAWTVGPVLLLAGVYKLSWCWSTSSASRAS